MTDSNSTSVFNTYLEAGVRSIALLNAYYPLTLDFESLIKVDYIMVNSGEFGGPENIHPFTPNRIGELAARRESVRLGVNLMRKFGMIELEIASNGVYYRVTGEAQPYLKLMRSNYSKRLLKSAAWLASELKTRKFRNFDLALSGMVY